MQTFYYPDIPKNCNPVATTGFFDGVHEGHRAVLSKLTDEAKKLGKQSCVITFWPHPRIVLNKETKGLHLLSTLDEKKLLLEREGIDLLCIIPFTMEFSMMNAHDFFSHYLRDALNVAKLIVGYDHHFGHDGQADFPAIQHIGSKYDIEVTMVEASKWKMSNISSTKVREALHDGNIALANALLGYPYHFSGTVVEGSRLGNKIGFPTANIQIDSPLKLIPKIGVYAIVANVNGNNYAGMMNIGHRPTISNDLRLAVEVHLFDFNLNIYGSGVRVECLERVRDEQKFESMEQLAEQLKEDKRVVNYLLKNRL